MVEVFSIELEGKIFFLAKKDYHSILEYCTRAGINIVKGVLNEGKPSDCLTLEEFTLLLNGELVKEVGTPDGLGFTPCDWTAGFIPIYQKPMTTKQRAIDVKRFIREVLLSGQTLTLTSLVGLYPELSALTLRRAITKVCKSVSEEVPCIIFSRVPGEFLVKRS